jgi:hypothetical protein
LRKCGLLRLGGYYFTGALKAFEKWRIAYPGNVSNTNELRESFLIAI